MAIVQTYEQQLTDTRWIIKAHSIKSRDSFRCVRCFAAHDLQVHHQFYLVGLAAWEYPDFALVTLCRACHKQEHETRKIPLYKLIGYAQ